MAMSSAEILSIYDKVNKKDPKHLVTQFLKSPDNALRFPRSGQRKNSVMVADSAFGDSGKGTVAYKYNLLLNERKNLISIGPNGGGNTGHEVEINGKKIVFSYIPTAAAIEGTLSILGRGKVIHPEEFLAERDRLRQDLGGEIPGKIIIDEHATLCLDTHRAYETILRAFTDGGKGSTKSGIAPAYASLYERNVVTVKDLLADDWKETLTSHYQFYQNKCAGFGDGFQLAEQIVKGYGEETERLAGTLPTFLDRLGRVRDEIKKYASNQVYEILDDAWTDENVPISGELGQGPGIDPWHGVYPDVTASRPLTRSIGDSTYGIVQPEDVALRVGVNKTIYMSSVGVRVLPGGADAQVLKMIGLENREQGKKTGRVRDIYEMALPILQYLRRADGYEYMVTTHLDAAKADRPVNVVTHFVDRATGQEAPYKPYQDELDKLEARMITFPGWDGAAIKDAKSIREYPPELIRYLAFLSLTIAPIAMGTYGPAGHEYHSFLHES